MPRAEFTRQGGVARGFKAAQQILDLRGVVRQQVFAAVQQAGDELRADVRERFALRERLMKVAPAALQ